jgi:hypothetical protein
MSAPQIVELQEPRILELLCDRLKAVKCVRKVQGRAFGVDEFSCAIDAVLGQMQLIERARNRFNHPRLVFRFNAQDISQLYRLLELIQAMEEKPATKSLAPAQSAGSDLLVPPKSGPLPANPAIAQS